jgi:DNA-binding MarR family transcriptional regulator
MTEAVATQGRHKNSLLQAIETFDELRAPRPFHTMMLFLYVCENEGLTVTELAFVTRSTVSSTARLVRALAGQNTQDAPYLRAPLFDLEGSPKDRRLKFIHLSPQGQSLRSRLEAVIAAAKPILG